MPSEAEVSYDLPMAGVSHGRQGPPLGSRAREAAGGGSATALEPAQELLPEVTDVTGSETFAAAPPSGRLVS